MNRQTDRQMTDMTENITYPHTWVVKVCMTNMVKPTCLVDMFKLSIGEPQAYFWSFRVQIILED